MEAKQLDDGIADTLVAVTSTGSFRARTQTNTNVQ
jgi:hypothetical protein